METTITSRKRPTITSVSVTSDSEVNGSVKEGSEFPEELMNGEMKEEEGERESGSSEEEEDSEDEEEEEDDSSLFSSSDSETEPVPGTSQPADYTDSSDEEDLRNTIGNIPVSWYDDLEHVGYDADGKKIKKPGLKRSEIDELLAKLEDPDYWRKVQDRSTGEEVKLSDEQVDIIRHMQGQKYPEIGYNPYQPFLDFFSHEVMEHPVTNHPPHKRSFIPSKLDKEKVSKMVHAIKMGWLKPQKKKSEDDEELKFYDLWGDGERGDLSKSQAARLKMHIPAPKTTLPDHSESYNPPSEYLPSKEEVEKWERLEKDERPKNYLPQKFSSMREVPGYPTFIQERFERCLDLYLAPRQRKMRLNVDAKDLLPDLPKPQDLQPFPTTLALTLSGHTGLVRALAMEPRVGQYLASGGDDGQILVWELGSGRRMEKMEVGGTVHSLSWCPNHKLTLLIAAVDKNVIILNPNVGDKMLIADTNKMMKVLKTDESTNSPVVWNKTVDKDGIQFRLQFEHEVKFITWHAKGDYFATVSPGAGAKSVYVHQLSQLKSQSPLSKVKRKVQCVLFHPTQPLFFVADDRHVKVYDLIKQQLMKKLLPNSRSISYLALHPKGDNLICGGHDCRLTWFDLDLSSKPYKTLRHHKGAVRGVDFHKKHPLFASCSDDGTTLVFHGRVFSDLLQNPLIVPVKVLRGHRQVDGLGVVSCVFHPHQPWIVTAGADSTVRVFTN